MSRVEHLAQAHGMRKHHWALLGSLVLILVGAPGCDFEVPSKDPCGGYHVIADIAENHGHVVNIPIEHLDPRGSEAPRTYQLEDAFGGAVGHSHSMTLTREQLSLTKQLPASVHSTEQQSHSHQVTVTATASYCQ
jgi:hypothetical protein